MIKSRLDCQIELRNKNVEIMVKFEIRRKFSCEV